LLQRKRCKIIFALEGQLSLFTGGALAREKGGSGKRKKEILIG